MGSKINACVIAKLSPEEFLALDLSQGVFHWGGQDHTINESIRYDVFRRSMACAECGVKGEYYLAEYFRGSSETKPHFNLYATGANGNQILMTRDHIIPKSLGGPDELWNLQTMCVRCNNKKAHKIPDVMPEIPLGLRSKFIMRAHNKISDSLRHLEFAAKFPELKGVVIQILKECGYGETELLQLQAPSGSSGIEIEANSGRSLVPAS